MFGPKVIGDDKVLPFASQNGKTDPDCEIWPFGGTPVKITWLPLPALKLWHQAAFVVGGGIDVLSSVICFENLTWTQRSFDSTIWLTILLQGIALKLPGFHQLLIAGRIREVVEFAHAPDFVRRISPLHCLGQEFYGQAVFA